MESITKVISRHCANQFNSKDQVLISTTAYISDNGVNINSKIERLGDLLAISSQFIPSDALESYIAFLNGVLERVKEISGGN